MEKESDKVPASKPEKQDSKEQESQKNEAVNFFRRHIWIIAFLAGVGSIKGLSEWYGQHQQDQTVGEVNKMIMEKTESDFQGIISKDQFACWPQEASSSDENRGFGKDQEGCVYEYEINKLTTILPENVLNLLRAYDSKKVEMLDNTTVIDSDEMGIEYGVYSSGVHGAYLGRFDGYDTNNKPALDPETDQHSILLPSFQGLEGSKAQLHLAIIIVHEVFGHALDDNGDLTSVLQLKNFAEDKWKAGEVEDDVYRETIRRQVSRVFRSELAAYTEMFRFIDWLIHSSDPELEEFRQIAKELYGSESGLGNKLYKEYLAYRDGGSVSDFFLKIAKHAI